MADQVTKASPDWFRVDLDGVKCETIRQQNIGKFKGLSHLFYTLDQRKEELTKRVNNKES